MGIIVDIMINGTIDSSILLLLLYLIAQNSSLSKKTSNAYIITIILTIIVILSEILTVVFNSWGSEGRTFNMIANIVGFTFSTCIPVSLAMVFDTKAYKYIKLCSIPIIINFIMLILSMWTGWIFSISSDNDYSRGPLFYVYVITYIICLIVLGIATYKNSIHLQRKDKVFLCCLLLLVGVGTSMQIIFSDVHSTWHCVTLAFVMYYLFLRELEFKYDIMTNMLNRQVFDKELEHGQKSQCLGIVMIDVDKFKNINDTYGHLKGDYCLEIIAQIIRNSFKKIGTYYRIGGDEFCVLCDHVNEDILRDCVKHIEIEILKAKEVDPVIPFVSLGYSIYKKSEDGDILAALKIADEKMYEYKKQKNVIV